MPTFYNQNAGTNKFKSKNDLQAAKRQKVPLTFLNPTTEEKSPEKSKSKSCLDLENMLSRNYFQAKTSIKVPLTFLNSSKENHQKNRYQNRVWIWKNMLIKKLIPSQMGKSSVKAEKFCESRNDFQAETSKSSFSFFVYRKITEKSKE